jgi:replicative superfamily II helicase
MVDFRARISAKKTLKPIDPLQLYDSLDRASDKGPLRPSQEEVLKKWHADHRDNVDAIVKLHTGQGKTLIGLLMLQSKLNEGVGPALYLCPDRYLVEQTANQAKQFGIRVLTSEQEPDLPAEFLNSECIYVATSQKLFNGLTKFKTGSQGIPIGAIVLDDCHAITDSIREKISIRIPKDNKAYQSIVALFSPSLDHQGPGTFEDIKSGKSNSTLKVPYWDLIDKSQSLRETLSSFPDDDTIKYTWPLLRDSLESCEIYISGDGLEISPLAIPIDFFSSFDKAKHRIFMSATVTDDAFLIRSLGLDPDAVTKPITYAKEKWSGEKMILLPELIDRTLDRGAIISWLGKANEKRKFGTVVLTTSNKSADDWAANGGAVANKDNIFRYVDSLRQGITAETVVIANRYDGIDLPDNACRILIIDGLPSAMSPSERYVEKTNYNGSSNKNRIFRKLEQGLGRSVRGEKDFSVILLTGHKMVSEVRSSSNRKYLSPQTRAQVEIGIEVSKMAQEDVEKREVNPYEALRAVMNQMLGRDAAWKDFYKDQMDSSEIHAVKPKDVGRHTAERKIDLQIRSRGYLKAAQEMQSLIDSVGGSIEKEEKGILLDRLANLTYFVDKKKALKLQESAHAMNPYVLFPPSPTMVNVEPRNVLQAAAIIEFLGTFDDKNALLVHIEETGRLLTFGQIADQFEQAMKNLGDSIGLSSTRPEREYRAGPDNLWFQARDEALCIECKSEVSIDRAEITKHEMAQLLNSSEWVKKHIGFGKVHPVIVIPMKMATREAAGSPNCRVIREKNLTKLRKSVTEFYKEVAISCQKGLPSNAEIDQLLSKYLLTIPGIIENFTEAIKYHDIKR